MRRVIPAILLTAAALIAAAHYARTATTHVQRFGSIIGIKPDQISAYKALHAAPSPGVRELLEKYNIHNYSIYIQKLDDGKYYLFSYYEYTGTDFKGDMAKAQAEPINQKWWTHTGPMQIPLAGHHGWTTMEEVFHNP
jgi:L-rhamnose mutarotase